ncbi:chaperonin: PROVISIONAL [Gigaspora margarita]|uniref:Chaperonin: PROVISIONAL n=1 Tax=Gigaspora margarita TaxID=4874 RepID=A0A8H4AE36_GIGMA|nr:chaperonin: PROVISIONAL [Gigaspora margarita]
MENSTHPLLNSIFSETHQELQTLQNDFLNLQIHFVNTNYENSQSKDYNEILEEDENDESNELLFISEYQLQKYHQIYNNNKIVDNLKENNLNNNEFEKLKTTINNNEETFIKQISETNCCQNNCLKEKINSKKAYLRNFNFQSLSKSNQDSFLMGYFIGISNLKNTSKGNKRIRISYNYSFDSEKICLQAFKFIYGIGSTRIENIKTHLFQEDIKARIHKSARKSSYTAIPFFTVIRIINFILSYANKWGLASPGQHFKREKIEITFLLAIENYTSLYRKYLDAIDQDKNIDKLYICLSSFKTIFKNFLPEIKFLTPRSDLCYFCKVM